jgi:hypothetical protein
VRTTEPLHALVVFGVPGVVEDLAELGVAPHAAAVLGRSGTAAADAHGMRDAVGRQELLDEDLMLPVVLLAAHGGAVAAASASFRAAAAAAPCTSSAPDGVGVL